MLESLIANFQVGPLFFIHTFFYIYSRKAIVNRLIQLQIRQEDLKEKQELSAITFETRGHTFVNYSHGIKIPGNKQMILI